MSYLWTQERTDAFKRLFDLKIYSFADIAIKLGDECGGTFSRCAMIGKARRMGLVSIARSSAPKSRPAAPPPLRCVEITPLGIGLLDLRDDECHYIAGDDRLYCGHPVKPGSAYCTPHHHLVWVTPLKTWRAAA